MDRRSAFIEVHETRSSETRRGSREEQIGSEEYECEISYPPRNCDTGGPESMTASGSGSGRAQVQVYQSHHQHHQTIPPPSYWYWYHAYAQLMDQAASSAASAGASLPGTLD